MKILLHTCCGPCLIYPHKILQDQGHEVTGFFYNPNIHPYREYKRRLDSLKNLSQLDNISLEVVRDYNLNDYFQRIVFGENNRCHACYSFRLEKSVLFAVENNFTGFSSTLLYSRYQKHSLIANICQDLAKKYSIEFFYNDFREGWQYGIDASISKDLYRQPYCGCIYSEQERFDNRYKKKMKKNIIGKDQ